MSVTYQHHQSLDILFSGPTSDTKTLWILNGSPWQLRRGTRFSCKLCRYSTEHDFWLNGSKSSRIQGFKWVSNHCAAVRYAVEMDASFQELFLLNNCPIEPKNDLSRFIRIATRTGSNMKLLWIQILFHTLLRLTGVLEPMKYSHTV